MLPEERVRLEDLEAAVRWLSMQMTACHEQIDALHQQMARRQAEQVVVESRVDRLERAPSQRQRDRIPTTTIPSGGSLSPLPSADSGPGE